MAFCSHADRLLQQTILGGLCSGEVWDAEGIRFLLTFVEGLLCAPRLRCHFRLVAALWGGSSEPMGILCGSRCQRGFRCVPGAPSSEVKGLSRSLLLALTATPGGRTHLTPK